MQHDSKLLALPTELLLHIFALVYHPWAVEFHIRPDRLIEHYPKQATVWTTPSPPSIAPLMTCKLVYQLTRSCILDSFAGLVATQDVPYLHSLGWFLGTSRWEKLKPRVRKLHVPYAGKYALSACGEFILQLPALRTVVLFDVLGLPIDALEYADSLDEQILAVPNGFFNNRAERHVPYMPEEIALSCNGGNIEVLFHVYFAVRRAPSPLPLLDVTFRLNADHSLEVFEKQWASRPVIGATNVPTI